jgi:acyl-homoserine-lactone acylase
VASEFIPLRDLHAARSDTLRGTVKIIAAFAVAAAAIASCGRATVDLPSADRLARQVTIRRDTFGIPHILADTEEAAAFAFGYAQAEDHALEIARRLIAARGEEAKYFGASGAAHDVGMAHFDNLAEARRGLSRVSPLYRRILAAYAAGVNRYVAQHRRELPEWIPDFGPADVLAAGRAGAVDALSGPALRRQLQSKYEPQASGRTRGAIRTAEGPTTFSEDGSNAFALAGSRTTTGRPILLGNPHLSWSSLYWEAHVRVPGRIDFYGSTLVGIPVLRAGFNDRLGFVTTNNAPDLDDVFALTLDRSRADHYLFDGRSMPLTPRSLNIQVKNDDGSYRTETQTRWSSHLGPVVYRTNDRAFAVKSTRLDAFAYFEGLYLASRARSLAEWLAAMRRNHVPTSNFTYADADGNILYLWNARLPVRRDGLDYRLDVPASSSGDVWTQLHRLDDLPRLLNPPGGYVQNANNPPRFASLRDPIDMARYPSYVERGPLALRPQLALDMLEARGRFSVDDVIRTKYDTRMLLAERVKRALIDAVRSAPSAPEEARAGAEALEAWDDRVSAGSRGAALFTRFWDRYAAAVPQPFATPWQPADPARTPHGLSDPHAAVTHLAHAVTALRADFGSERVAWGDTARFRAGEVDVPGDGAPGAYGTYRVMRFDAVDQNSPVRIAGNPGRGRAPVGFGDAWILVVDFSRPVTGWSVLAYGQTTNLASPHSRDQIRIFAEHRLRRAWFTEAEIRSNLEREYRP